MKAASGHCASTKHPPSVDKCHPPAVRINKIPSQRGQMPPPTVRIHKIPSQRGQMPPPGSAHPQNTLPAWTNATPRQCASTKHPPSVDKCHSPAVRILKTSSQRGQMPPPAVRIHKTPSQRGQMRLPCSAHPQNTLPAWTNATPRQSHPQNTLPVWTNAASGQCASTKHHSFVDAGNHFRGQWMAIKKLELFL